MTGRVGAAMLIGSVVFMVITLFEQIPVIGWDQPATAELPKT